MREYFDKLYTKEPSCFFSEMDHAMDHDEKQFIVTANPETLMIADADPAFHQVLIAEETIIVPDGIGLVKASAHLNIPIRARITGVELAEHLIAKAGQSGKKIYLYGAKEDVVSVLAQRIGKEYPLARVLYRNGYGQDDDVVFQDIVTQAPDLVLVALGIPRQELLIHRYLSRFQKGIFIGVGGSFDVLSGMKKRAPRLFIRLNLEWLYRIIKEPKRIKRFYTSNVRFLFKVQKMRKSARKIDGN